MVLALLFELVDEGVVGTTDLFCPPPQPAMIAVDAAKASAIRDIEKADFRIKIASSKC